MSENRWIIGLIFLPIACMVLTGAVYSFINISPEKIGKATDKFVENVTNQPVLHDERAEKYAHGEINFLTEHKTDALNSMLIDWTTINEDMQKNIVNIVRYVDSNQKNDDKDFYQDSRFAFTYFKIIHTYASGNIVADTVIVYLAENGHYKTNRLTFTVTPDFVNQLYNMENRFIKNNKDRLYSLLNSQVIEPNNTSVEFEGVQQVTEKPKTNRELEHLPDILSSSLGRFNAYKTLTYPKSQYYYSVDKGGHTHKEMVDHDKMAVVNLNIVGDKDGFALIEATTLEPGQGVKDMVPVIDAKEHLWVVPDEDKDDMIKRINLADMSNISTGNEHDLDFHAHQWDKLSEQDVIHIVNQVSK